MKRTRCALSVTTAALLCTLLVPGCTREDRSPIPPAGTRVSSTSEVFQRTARDLAGQCEAIGGCTCFLDGIQTTCSVVFACLDAGFCELAP
jgi:hypothetical protein